MCLLETEMCLFLQWNPRVSKTWPWPQVLSWSL